MSNFLSYLNYISIIFYISQFNNLIYYVEIEISTASLININLICIAHLNFVLAIYTEESDPQEY